MERADGEAGVRRHANRAHREPVLAPVSGPSVSCAGKRQYATFQDAQHVASKMRRHTDECMGAYRCRHCQRWHLGHQTPRR